MELSGQLAAAAAQVDHPATGHGPDQCEQVVEGGGPLGREPLVPRRVPGVHAAIQAARPPAVNDAGGSTGSAEPDTQVGIGPSRELECGCR